VALQGEELARFIVGIADREGVPRRALLGLAYAESTWHSGARRPTDPARDEEFWPDVSGGAFQQTVAFSDELHARGLNWRSYPGPDVVAEILDAYYDPDHAATVAAGKLRALLGRADVKGDEFLGLCRYNKPNAEASAGVQANYRRGLEQADAFLATFSDEQPDEQPVEAHMDDALADLWGAVRDDLAFDDALAIVGFWKENWKDLGSPVGPEHQSDDGNTYQAFARGIVRWKPDVGAEIV